MCTPENKWTRWHPFARSIAQRLVQRDEPDLTADELTELKVELAKIFGREELETAVRDVLFLAAALEHDGLGSLAEKLFALVETKVVLGALDRINHVRAIDRSEQIVSRAKRFAAFAHTEAAASRPAARGAAAEGARPLRVRDLAALHVIG